MTDSKESEVKQNNTVDAEGNSINQVGISEPGQISDMRGERTRAILVVLVWTGLLNLGTCLAKMIVGYYTGIYAIFSGGIASLTDTFVNVLGFVSMKIAGRPPSERHPYGYEKYETFATVIIGSVCLVLFFEVLKSGIGKLFHPDVNDVTPIAYAAMVVSLLLNVVTVIYERGKGRKLRSEFLMADSSETISDILVGVGVIVGLVLISAGWVWLDGVLAIGISLVILRTALAILRQAARVLTDEAVLDPEEVASAVQDHPEIAWTHMVRSRGNADAVYVDLHIGLDPGTTVAEAHDRISHEVKRLLLKRFPGIKCVTTHIEPDNESARKRARSVFRYRDF